MTTPVLRLGAGLSLLILAGAFGLFVRVYKEATRLGLIARYSSESVN